MRFPIYVRQFVASDAMWDNVGYESPNLGIFAIFLIQTRHDGLGLDMNHPKPGRFVNVILGLKAGKTLIGVVLTGLDGDAVILPAGEYLMVISHDKPNGSGIILDHFTSQIFHEGNGPPAFSLFFQAPKSADGKFLPSNSVFSTLRHFQSVPALTWFQDGDRDRRASCAPVLGLQLKRRRGETSLGSRIDRVRVVTWEGHQKNVITLYHVRVLQFWKVIVGTMKRIRVILSLHQSWPGWELFQHSPQADERHRDV